MHAECGSTRHTADAIPVLMYHHISPTPGLVTLSPARFEEHIRTLTQYGYHTIGCEDLLGFLRGKRTLSRHSVLLTFDDGYLDNYVYAYPILRRYQQKAALFLITNAIGTGKPRATSEHAAPALCLNHAACTKAMHSGHPDDAMLRWSEIEKMRQDSTFEFHSHTHTHTRWDQQDPLQRLAHIAEELSASRSRLIAQLGFTSTHLCWPQGYYEPAYQQLAVEAGFEALYTTEKKINSREASPLCIGRFVAKDRPDRWLRQRLWVYSRPMIGKWYSAWRGK